MILALLLAAQDYSPETNAVMDRARRDAAQQRASEKSASEASPLPLPPDVAKKLEDCLTAAQADPVVGLQFASDWSTDGGSYHAAQCAGYAQARAEKWPQAVAAFRQGAERAERAKSATDAARLWAQAGNAALAGGQAQEAIGLFDAALGQGASAKLAKGEILLDRARALVSLNRLPEARHDIDGSLALADADPLAWLLSATLARRMDQLERAKTDIEQAVRRAPDDASVATEQGNIAILSSDETGAQAAWQRAVKLAPDSDAGKRAAAALTELDATPR